MTLLSLPEWYVREDARSSFRTTQPTDDYDYFTANDQFSLGQTLRLAQLLENEDISSPGSISPEARAVQAAVTVDGILWDTPDLSLGTSDSPVVITTPQGLQALGLWCGNTQSLSVSLTDPADRASEEAVRQALSRILEREDHLVLINQLENNRSALRRRFTNTLFVLCVSALFLTLALSQLTGSFLRDIRAQRRSLEILTALGCPRDLIPKIYTRQIIFCGAAAFLLGIPVSWLIFAWDAVNGTLFLRFLLVSLLCSILVSLLCARIVTHSLPHQLHPPEDPQ